MKGQRLFEIMSFIDDDLIDEAEDYKHRVFRRLSWMKMTVVAACLMLSVCIGVWIASNHLKSIDQLIPPMAGTGSSGGGSQVMDGEDNGSAFMHYAGPVLPLTAEGDTGDITANRETSFNFIDSTDYGNLQLTVEDSYSLTNHSSEEKDVKLIYPFISSLSNSGKYLPKIYVNGEEQETEILAGEYTGGFAGPGEDESYNLSYLKSWEGYRELLKDGKYLEEAKKDREYQDEEVTVWTFTDEQSPENLDAATLAVEFSLPEGSTVMTYGINGGEYDDDTRYRRYSYFLSKGRSGSHRIIILGQPPTEYKIKGYENGACDKEVSEVSGTIHEEKMLKSEALKLCMDEYMERYVDLNSMSPLVTEKQVYDVVMSTFNYTSIGHMPKDRYQLMMLEDIIGESITIDRVMYVTVPVTIKAGETIQVKSEFLKDGSYNFGGAGPKENRGLKGFDMMTHLGSSLTFTEQKAKIVLPDKYEIVRQNFGFNLAEGHEEVVLDMDAERYYIEIRQMGE